MMGDKIEVPGLMLVRIHGTTVHMVIDYPFFEHNLKDTPEEHAEHQRYYVEDHTCPTNLVRVEAILWDGDADPHGVLEFVDHVRKPDGYDEDDGNDHDWNFWVMLFPALGGQIIEGSATRGGTVLTLEGGE